MADVEEIKLKTGESARIKCKGLGTAGYQWNYMVDKKELVDISKDWVMPPAKKKPLAGASADEVFIIKANKKGTANIYLFQKRSWEKEPANERRVRVVIG
ncbi:MAG TPA: protease inhibitor I42 family protein [Chitinophagaceae bacterium]|nr:protease inhibitor I42 family protein [Chitinophagaceae bacterium]